MCGYLVGVVHTCYKSATRAYIEPKETRQRPLEYGDVYLARRVGAGGRVGVRVGVALAGGAPVVEQLVARAQLELVPAPLQQHERGAAARGAVVAARAAPAQRAHARARRRALLHAVPLHLLPQRAQRLRLAVQLLALLRRPPRQTTARPPLSLHTPSTHTHTHSRPAAGGAPPGPSAAARRRPRAAATRAAPRPASRPTDSCAPGSPSPAAGLAPCEPDRVSIASLGVTSRSGRTGYVNRETGVDRPDASSSGNRS